MCVSEGKKCSFFRKNWRALFSCNTLFEIRSFALLPRSIHVYVSMFLLVLLTCFSYLINHTKIDFCLVASAIFKRHIHFLCKIKEFRANMFSVTFKLALCFHKSYFVCIKYLDTLYFEKLKQFSPSFLKFLIVANAYCFHVSASMFWVRTLLIKEMFIDSACNSPQ